MSPVPWASPAASTHHAPLPRTIRRTSRSRRRSSAPASSHQPAPHAAVRVLERSFHNHQQTRHLTFALLPLVSTRPGPTAPSETESRGNVTWGFVEPDSSTSNGPWHQVNRASCPLTLLGTVHHRTPTASGRSRFAGGAVWHAVKLSEPLADPTQPLPPLRVTAPHGLTTPPRHRLAARCRADGPPSTLRPRAGRSASRGACRCAAPH